MPAGAPVTRPRGAAVEATLETTAVSALPIPTMPASAAPVRAASTTEASTGASVATPTTDTGWFVEQAPSTRDHESRQEKRTLPRYRQVVQRCQGVRVYPWRQRPRRLRP